MAQATVQGGTRLYKKWYMEVHEVNLKDSSTRIVYIVLQVSLRRLSVHVLKSESQLALAAQAESQAGMEQ